MHMEFSNLNTVMFSQSLTYLTLWHGFAENKCLVFICCKSVYPHLCLVFGSVLPSWFLWWCLFLCGLLFLLFFFLFSFHPSLPPRSKGIAIGLYFPFGESEQHCLSLHHQYPVVIPALADLVPPLSCHFFPIVLHCRSAACCFRSGVTSVLHVQQGHLFCIVSVSQVSSEPNINFQEVSHVSISSK